MSVAVSVPNQETTKLDRAPYPQLAKHQRMLEPVLAGLLGVLPFILANVILRRFPFGDAPRDISDLGAQFVPFHALLARAVGGEPFTDALFTWQVGYGVPWIGDYATYTASPFALVAFAFGPDQASLALFVITAVKLATAGATMAIFLRHLRSTGSRLWLLTLSVSYASCGWAIDDATWMPMWLDGLWTLPLLLLAVEWTRQRQHLVLSVLFVAVSWWSNYYTAYMATVLAVIYFVVRASTEWAGWRREVSNLGAFALRGALGVGLTAVLLLPTAMLISDAQPAEPVELTRKPWTFALARFLPMTDGAFAAPGFFVGAAAVAVTGALFLNRHVPLLTRIIYPVVAGALFLSMMIPTTMIAWHAFSAPHGGPFRAAWILCAWLVLSAWLARPEEKSSRWQMAVAALIVCVLGATSLVGAGRDAAHPISLLVWGIAALGVFAAWGLQALDRRTLSGVTILVVTIGVSVANASWMESHKGGFHTYVPWEGPTATADNWPEGRGSAGPDVRANGSALAGYAGGTYYSSLAPQETSTMLASLELGWTSSGRGWSDPSDEVAAALLGVTTQLTSDLRAGSVQGQQVAAVPLVRTVPTVEGNPATMVAARNAIAGAALYEEVETLITVNGLPADIPQTGLGLSVVEGDAISLAAVCSAASRLQLVGPFLSADVTYGASRASVHAEHLDEEVSTRAGVQTLGAAQGPVVVDGVVTEDSFLTRDMLACANEAVFASLVEAPGAPVALQFSGSRVDAQWATPQTGTVIVATAMNKAWVCSADGRQIAAKAVAGLLAVSAEGISQVSCEYTPRSFHAGLYLSLGSLLALVGLCVVDVIVRRKRANRVQTAS